jgi:hypothetical protein
MPGVIGGDALVLRRALLDALLEEGQEQVGLALEL